MTYWSLAALSCMRCRKKIKLCIILVPESEQLMVNFKIWLHRNVFKSHYKTTDESILCPGKKIYIIFSKPFLAVLVTITNLKVARHVCAKYACRKH
jgi:hypothetical protein